MKWFQYAKLVTCRLANLVDFSLITLFYCVCAPFRASCWQNCESLYMHKRMRLPKYIFVMDSVWRWLKREFSLMFQRAPQTNIRVCYIHLDFGYLKTATKEPKLTSKEMVRHVHHVFNMVSMVFVCQIRGNSFCLISCML